MMPGEIELHTCSIFHFEYNGILLYTYYCSNKVKAMRDGIYYCSVHDPVMIEKRRIKIQKKKFDIREKKRLLWNKSQ